MISPKDTKKKRNDNMKEVVLRFKAKDEKTAHTIMQSFYELCMNEPKVYGWGLLSMEEEK